MDALRSSFPGCMLQTFSYLWSCLNPRPSLHCVSKLSDYVNVWTRATITYSRGNSRTTNDLFEHAIPRTYILADRYPLEPCALPGPRARKKSSSFRCHVLPLRVLFYTAKIYTSIMDLSSTPTAPCALMYGHCFQLFLLCSGVPGRTCSVQWHGGQLWCKCVLGSQPKQHLSGLCAQ